MSIAEFVYTTVLRPRPLKAMANALIRQCIPDRLERNGAVTILNPRDPVISGALTFGVYEKAETAFFCSVCQPGMIFLDIGANVGYYTALASGRIGKQGKIIALEPDRENFQYLKRTVAANGAEHAVCIRKAAADRNGSTRLYISANNRGDHRLYANDLSGSSYEVEISTIDEILKEQGLDSVDLVKIDVQGYEGHVLRGMRETIRRSNRLILLTEFWPFGLRSAGTAPEDVLTELTESGMRLYELTGKGRLVGLADPKGFIERHRGRRYANIVGVKGGPLSGNLEPGA
ncbi:MAG TPA: FkbM family methyltransferase [Bryobacteraceae bacterium]|nr:FkbM family methyltransferase [Bryobacteraceae bacterium]